MQAKHTTQHTHGWTIGSHLTNLVNLKATDLEKHYSARIPKTQYCVRFPEFIRKVKSLLVQVVSDPLHKLLAWHVLLCEPPKVYPVLHSKVVMFWYTGLDACAVIFPLSGGGSAAQVATANTSRKEEQTLLYILITSFRYWKEMCSPIVFNLAFFFFYLWSVISNANSPSLRGTEHSSSFLMFILIDLWLDFHFRSV